MPLSREKRHRLLIEGNEGFPAKPIAFVGNDAIGKIAARVERQQAGLHGGPVHFHVGGGQRGRLIFHVFGALGQCERDLIRDRAKAGLSAAAARGRKGGRKPVVTADKLQRAREHIANGLNVREATRLKAGKTALYAALQSESKQP